MLLDIFMLLSVLLDEWFSINELYLLLNIEHTVCICWSALNKFSYTSLNYTLLFTTEFDGIIGD